MTSNQSNMEIVEGKPQNTTLDETKKKILALRSSYEYELSNCKHFQELLKERENIDISYSVVYAILRNAGIKSPKKTQKNLSHIIIVKELGITMFPSSSPLMQSK